MKFIKLLAVGILIPTLALASYLGDPVVVKSGGTGLSTVPSAGQILIGNAGGTAYALALMSGDATMAASGALTIANSAITNAKIANGTIDLTAKVTGILPNANTTADSADTASAIVVRDASGNFSAGTITAALTGTASGNLTAVSVASANGFAGSSSGGATPALTLSTTVTGNVCGNGTALSACTTTGSGSTVLATSPTIVTPTIAKLANLTTNGYVKTSNSDGTLSVQAVAIPVADGGTGQTSYTDGQLLIGNSSGNTLSKSTLTAGSNITITNGNGSITIAASGGGTAPNDIVRVSNAGGNGSTGTKIRWYGTLVTNTGSAITYTSSSVNGDSWTINTAGTYCMAVSDLSSSQANVGITLNQSSLTTNPYSLPDSQLLDLVTGPQADFSTAVTWCGPLAVNDVLRVCADIANVGTVPQRARVTVSRMF